MVDADWLAVLDSPDDLELFAVSVAVKVQSQNVLEPVEQRLDSERDN